MVHGRVDCYATVRLPRFQIDMRNSLEPTLFWFFNRFARLAGKQEPGWLPTRLGSRAQQV